VVGMESDQLGWVYTEQRAPQALTGGIRGQGNVEAAESDCGCGCRQQYGRLTEGRRPGRQARKQALASSPPSQLTAA
jgi:hypothetical protein